MKYILIMILTMLTHASCSEENGLPEIAPPAEPEPPAEAGGSFRIVVGSAVFTATFYDTRAAEAFRAVLPLTFTMSDMNDNEKYSDLPQSLPVSAVRPGTIHNGELMLYGSNTLVLFYKTFSSSYSYTRIGKADDPSGLEVALGEGNIFVRFEPVNSQ